MNSGPTVAITASSGTAKAGELRTVSIRKIESGFIGSCSYQGKPGRDGYPKYVPEKEYALTSREDVHAFLDEVFGFGKKKAGTPGPDLKKRGPDWRD